jgi:tellurium resistance protein TerD
LAVSIHDAVERRQNFGQVPNAFIRLVDPVSNNELCRYDLREDFSGATVVIFGEIYKHQTDWKFRAVGKAFNGDLGALVNIFA